MGTLQSRRPAKKVGALSVHAEKWKGLTRIKFGITLMKHVKHGSNAILSQSTLKESNSALLWSSVAGMEVIVRHYFDPAWHGSSKQYHFDPVNPALKESKSALLGSSMAGMEVISNIILIHSTLKSSISALLWSSIFGMEVIPFWPSQPLRYQIRHYFDELEVIPCLPSQPKRNQIRNFFDQPWK